MIPIKPALNYFRDCYRLDTRTTQLDNFFGRKVEHRYVFDGKERLLNRNMPYLPIPDDVGEKFNEVLTLYSKEKALYYCSFFVVGYGISINDKRVRVCAPLFLHETKLSKNEEGYSIKIEAQKRMINIDPIAALRKSADVDARYSISKDIPAEIFDFGSMSKLQKVLTSCYDDLNADELLLYPSLTNEATIKRLYNLKGVKEGSFKIVPAAGLGIMKRSSNTQGIMTELAEMAASTTSLPPSIMSLFGYKVTTSLPEVELGHVPAILNESQQQIIENAHNHHFSVAIGPPGTGKSFTIASLAIEFMSRGKSVLIVSKTDQAVNVIDHKITNDLNIKNATVRAGRQDYLKQLKARIEDILKGTPYQKIVKLVNTNSGLVHDLEQRISGCNRLLEDSRREFEKLLKHEAKWGEALMESDSSLFSKLKTKYINWLTYLKEPHWLIAGDYMHAIETRTELIREFIAKGFDLRIKKLLIRNRHLLKDFLKAIRARTSSRREKLFDQLSFQDLFDVLPIWLCKLSDLQQVLPLKKHLFDVVIIDEATQCDVASCLPAIYRGTRTVIVGDPKQLRHVSFLSQSAQHSLQRKYGLEDFTELLDYRNRSILDMVDDAVQSQSQITFLNEHYRSLPDLIAFSNKHFYGNELKIMSVIPEDHSIDNIHHIAVTGQRNKQGVNALEAEAILQDIQQMVDDETILPLKQHRTIGILSPFRDQVDYLSSEVLKRFNSDHVENHNILCGTAHSFQGEERDVMFLSFCLDNESHSTGFNHFDKPDIFNVSVTRAKSKVNVYTSFDLAKLKVDSYLKAYIEHAAKPMRSTLTSKALHDGFLNEVKAALAEHSFDFRVGYEIADLSLDLVILQEHEMVGIDLIGYPGVFEEGLSLSAYKVLHRVGIRTFPLPYSFWKFDQEQCVAALIDFVTQKTATETS